MRPVFPEEASPYGWSGSSPAQLRKHAADGVLARRTNSLPLHCTSAKHLGKRQDPSPGRLHGPYTLLPMNDGADASQVQAALLRLGQLHSGSSPTAWIADVERRLANSNLEGIQTFIATEGIGPETLWAALLIKALAGQINVVVHAVGLLVSLPYVLEPHEQIQGLSLGAGNTGRAFDLETDLRVSEFKFIAWRGGPEAIRQNSVFIDFFNLASANTSKRRTLYLVDTHYPLRFLRSRRALDSVLSKDRGAALRFKNAYGDAFSTVGEYYDAVKEKVEIVDLRDRVPALRAELA